MSFPPISPYLVTLELKYLPQYPVFKNPQTVFLPQCDRPSFTPLSDKRQIYNSSVYKLL
jgi:hypothetical protein